MPMATFHFISEYITNLANIFTNFQLKNVETIPMISASVKPVRIAPRTGHQAYNKPTTKFGNEKPRCGLCTYKNFKNRHWPFSFACGVKKLSSSQIIQLLSKSNSCPTCGISHPPCGNCASTFPNGATKICKRCCLHDGMPLNRAASKHNDETSSATVSKVGSDKSIPMVENMMVDLTYLDIQYDTGCQLSLINLTALKLLPSSCYTLGKTTQINLLAFDRMGKTHTATEVVLHLSGFSLKMIAVDRNLSSGSIYSFPTPIGGKDEQELTSHPILVTLFCWVEITMTITRLK